MSFNIKKEEFVNKTFRLNKELVEKCSIEASLRDVSLNAFVTAALGYALENLEDVSEERIELEKGEEEEEEER